MGEGGSHKSMTDSRTLTAGDQVSAQPCAGWVVMGCTQWLSWWRWWLEGGMWWGQAGGGREWWSVSGHFRLKSEPSRTTPATVTPVRTQRLKRSWPFLLSAAASFP